VVRVELRRLDKKDAMEARASHVIVQNKSFGSSLHVLRGSRRRLDGPIRCASFSSLFLCWRCCSLPLTEGDRAT